MPEGTKKVNKTEYLDSHYEASLLQGLGINICDIFFRKNKKKIFDKEDALTL